MECTDCKVGLTPDNTYKRAGRKADFPKGYYRKCKKCYSKDRQARSDKNKQRILDRMGGCCQSCGYDKCVDALELHHRDPAKKDKGTTRHIRHITDEQRLQSELDKCVLLCSNCHRETHAGLHPEFLIH